MTANKVHVPFLLSPVHEYYVEVFTGDKFGAGTDANVYLQLFGERGDTGKRHLHGTKTDGKMFESGMVRCVFVFFSFSVSFSFVCTTCMAPRLTARCLNQE